MLKRLARIAGLTLGCIVVVALVWHVVRFELLFLGAGASVDDAYVTFGNEEIYLEGVVVEVVLVEGMGREDQFVTLAPGTWRATVEVVDSDTDSAQISSVDGYASTIRWSTQISSGRTRPRPAVFVVGDRGTPGVTLYGREFRVRTNAIVDNHPWSVTLERFDDRWP